MLPRTLPGALPLLLLVGGLSGQVAFADPYLHHRAPPQAPYGRPLPVRGFLSDSAGVERLILRYRSGDGEWEAMALERTVGDLYEGEIPAKALRPPTISYWVAAVVRGANPAPVHGTALRPVVVSVSVPPGFLADAASNPEEALREELALYGEELAEAVVLEQPEEAPGVDARAWVLEREDLERLGALSLVDAVDVLPGVSVSRDVTGAWNVAARGQRSAPELRVLLDGVRVDALWDGRSLLDLPLELFERVELTLGPAPVHAGEVAYGAVLRLTTRSEEGIGAALVGGRELGPDALDLQAVAWGGGSLGPDVRFHGDLAVVRHHGAPREVLGDSLDRDAVAQGLRLEGEPAGATLDDRWTVVGGARAHHTPGAGKLGAWARVLIEDRSALIGLFDVLGSGSRLSWRTVNGGLTYERPLAERVRLSSRLTVGNHGIDRLFQRAPDGYSTAADPLASPQDQLFPEGMLDRREVSEWSIALDGRVDWSLDSNNELSAGVRLEHRQLSHLLRTNYAYEGERLIRTEGALAEPLGLAPIEDALLGRTAATLWAEDRWALTPWLRLQAGFRARLVQLPTVDDAQRLSGSGFTPLVEPEAALTLLPVAPLRIDLSYRRATRTPTVEELGVDLLDMPLNRGQFLGNPSLRTSSIDAVELSVDHLQRVELGTVRTRAAAFYEHLGSPIRRVDFSGNLVPIRNGSAIRVIGAEGALAFTLNRDARAWVNASWFRAWDLEQGNLLTDLPQLRLNAGLTLPVGPWLTADLVIRSGSERRNNARTGLESLRRWSIPAYQLVSAQLRTRRLLGHVELALLGQNVLQQVHLDDAFRADRTIGQVPRAGASAFLMVRVYD